jgi:hypothetical protein
MCWELQHILSNAYCKVTDPPGNKHVDISMSIGGLAFLVILHLFISLMQRKCWITADEMA